MTKHASNKASLSKAENPVSQNSEIEKEISQDCETLPAGTEDASEASPPSSWDNVPEEIREWIMGQEKGGTYLSPCGGWWGYVATQGEAITAHKVIPCHPADCEKLGISLPDMTRAALGFIGSRKGKFESGLAKFARWGVSGNSKEAQAMERLRLKFPGKSDAELRAFIALVLGK